MRAECIEMIIWVRKGKGCTLTLMARETFIIHECTCALFKRYHVMIYVLYTIL